MDLDRIGPRRRWRRPCPSDGFVERTFGRTNREIIHGSLTGRLSPQCTKQGIHQSLRCLHISARHGRWILWVKQASFSMTNSMDATLLHSALKPCIETHEAALATAGEHSNCPDEPAPQFEPVPDHSDADRYSNGCSIIEKFNALIIPRKFDQYLLNGGFCLIHQMTQLRPHHMSTQFSQQRFQ